MTDVATRRSERQQKAQQRLGRALASLAGLALICSALLVLTGRSLLWRSVGYLLAALVATGLMAGAVRVMDFADASPYLQRRRLRRVIVFNVLCIGVSLAHAYYIARRLI